jgi:FkbM family methyltransferase
VSLVEGGIPGRIQLAMLLLAARVLRPFEYRGLRTITRLLASSFPATNCAVIEHGARKFRIYLNDLYYTWLLDRGFVYEPDLEFILDRVLSRDTVFVDGGANQGYWSIYAAQRIDVPGRIIAVEAVSSTFARTRENVQLNGNSFTAIRKAIYSSSNVDLEFETHAQRHGGNSYVNRRARPGTAGFQHEFVSSVSIDDLVSSIPSITRDTEVVVKLDIEGAEQDAFQGAQKVIDGGGLFIYEEHGRELTWHTSRFVLTELGLAAYLVHPHQEPIRIKSTDELMAFKRDPTKGYTLLAARTDSSLLQKALRKVE